MEEEQQQLLLLDALIGGTMNRCLVVVDEKAVGSRLTKAGNDGKGNGDDQEKKAGTKKSEKKEIEKAKKEIEKMKDEGGDELSFLGVCVQTGLIEKKRGERILVLATAYFLIDLGLGSFFLNIKVKGREPNRVYNYKWDTIVYEHTHTLSLPCFRRRR